ncbi:hypothetical protein [Campylobacter gastrosuis]|uniref:Uncharacterized protein n=1 Tax=Campylobacter gastrosuis TaxID=2974576 RepID=A0ABT7HPD7_9BACT|nr:hypothetical protein [Campylobacter gastrosuis]MDL0088768.1 hypothetical protein [Campylobacter gastrosuis]
MNEIVDLKTLPIDLQERIRDLLKCKENDNKDIDIYWSELYGSINSSQHGREITKEVADYLRDKYLGI